MEDSKLKTAALHLILWKMLGLKAIWLDSREADGLDSGLKSGAYDRRNRADLGRSRLRPYKAHKRARLGRDETTCWNRVGGGLRAHVPELRAGQNATCWGTMNEKC